MFGYIVPLKSELRMREWTQYQAWYCGLCGALRREYGQLPRLTLSYDCAFLALLLGGAEGLSAPCTLCRCGYKPLREKRPVAAPCNALAYAADINILLSYYKLLDDWRDEHKPNAWVGAHALHHAARRAMCRQPKAADAIERGILALSKMEAARETSIDCAADAFAGMLQNIVEYYPHVSSTQRTALSWLGYHMGRWIYLADAWEDRSRDKKHGAYNPFLINDVDRVRCSFLLHASLNEMCKAFDLLEIHANGGLLENILYQGCMQICRRVLEGEGDESLQGAGRERGCITGRDPGGISGDGEKISS